MANLERLTDDYSRSPVPHEAGVSGVRIAMVIVGFAITLPLMLTGSKLGLALGLRDALTAFLAGGLILALIGVGTSVVAARARLSTYKILEFSFGRLGAKYVSGLLALTLFGWYGVTAALFGQALGSAAVDFYGLPVSFAAGTIVGSVLMVAITVFGFKALDRLSIFAVPLLAVFLAIAVMQSLEGMNMRVGVDGGDTSLGVSISMVAGTYIVGVVLVPDLCRYARSVGHAVFAVVVALALGLPLILGAAAIPSLATKQADLVEIMLKLGLGLPALFVIVFATWTSNANNLYSMSLGLAAIFERAAKWKLTVAAGFIGTLVAVAGITDIFLPFLLVLGVAIPPIAGIYLADYFVVQGRAIYESGNPQLLSRANFAAFSAWLIAAGIGVLTSNGWVLLTRIPACDSFLAAAILYIAFCKLRHFHRH